MYSVSSAFLNAVQRSHKAVVLFSVLTPNGPIPVKISGGSVTIDGSAEIRTTCTVNIADPTLVPRQKGDLLHPDTGNEFEIQRGVLLPNGNQELVPLGIFTITKPSIVDSGNNFTFQITGSDRGYRVQRAQWTQPYPIAAGTDVTDAVRAALNDRIPGLPSPNFIGITSAMTTPTVTFGLDSGTNDPWADMQSLFSAYGFELFFDATGRPTARPIPDSFQSLPVASYVSGVGPLLSVQRDLDPAERYTAVVVQGEGTGIAAPVYAVATDPSATTIIPYFYKYSGLITSQDQANSIAQAMLLKHGSSYEDVQITIVPNSALTAGDVIHVERDPAGLSGSYVASQITIPLDLATPMTIVMTPQRSA